MWPVTYFLTISHTGLLPVLRRRHGRDAARLGIPVAAGQRLRPGHGAQRGGARGTTSESIWNGEQQLTPTPGSRRTSPRYGWIPFEPTPPSWPATTSRSPAAAPCRRPARRAAAEPAADPVADGTRRRSGRPRRAPRGRSTSVAPRCWRRRAGRGRGAGAGPLRGLVPAPPRRPRRLAARRHRRPPRSACPATVALTFDEYVDAAHRRAPRDGTARCRADRLAGATRRRAARPRRDQ